MNDSKIPTVFEVKVMEDGGIEARKVPSNEYCMNLTFWTEEALAMELRSYGQEHADIEDLICQLNNAETYEWVTV